MLGRSSPWPGWYVTPHCPASPSGYLHAPWHRGIVQQQLQDVEADDEHRDALGGSQRD